MEDQGEAERHFWPGGGLKGKKKVLPFSSPPHSSASKTRGKKVPMDEKEAVGELGGPDLSGVVVAERISM